MSGIVASERWALETYLLKRDLEKFLSLFPIQNPSARIGRNTSLSSPQFEIYIRIYRRGIGITLDLARIETRIRSQGMFSSLLPVIEETAKAAGVQVVRVENVFEDRFAKFFERHGYTRSILEDPDVVLVKLLE